MKKKRKLGRKLLSFLLTLAMIMGLVPGMSLTAYASSVIYNDLNTNNTTVQIKGVKYNGTNVADWYVIGYDSEAKTVTLLSKQGFASKSFNSNADKGHNYVGSDIEAYVKGLIGDGQQLAGIKDALANISGKVTGDPDTISGNVPYLLSYDEANALSETKRKGGDSTWWLRSPGTDDSTYIRAACVKVGNASESGNWVGGSLPVRPALKLDLSKVTFASVSLSGGANAAISGGTATQNYFNMGNTRGAITTVTYTAKTGYKFPETSELYKETNGITVTKTSDTVITVSGTPTANTEITIPDAVEDTVSDNPYASLLNTTTVVHFDGKDWYLIEDNSTAANAGTVTLLSKECVGASQFNPQEAGNTYSGSTVESFVNSWYTSNISTDAKAAVNGNGMFLLTKDQANNLSTDVLKCSPAFGAYNNSSLWWLCSQGSTATSAERVNGSTGAVYGTSGNVWIAFGVRPALKLDLSKVTFDSDAKTFTVGSSTVTPATVKKAPTAKTLTYNGSAQALVTAGLAEGGTMQYALGTDDKTAPTTGWSDKVPTATNVGTYYVWYKAVGDADHSDTKAKCLTVKISQKSSGGGGSYTPSTPSTPTTPSSTSAPAPTVAPTTVPSSTAAPTEDYTVPVTNENAVNVSTSITEGNAVVNEITQSDMDKIVNKNSEPGTGADENTSITIDVSKAKSEVTSIELTKTTIERLADTTSEQNNSVDTVTVQMTNAKVELDAETLAAVSEQAAGKSIRLVVDDKLKQASLNEKQRDVISTYEKATTFEAYFESDGKRIHDFKGGTAKVSVRYSLMSGLLARFIHMLYLNPTGEVERFITTYDGEWCTGDLPHFSEYAIVYDTSVSNKTGTEEDAAEAEKIAKDPYSGLDPEDWNADKNDFVADETTILPNGKTAYENGLAINSGLRLIQKGKTLTVTWGKVKGATGYKIYAEYCGTKMPDTPIKTIKSGSKVKVVIKELHGKKLNKKKNYKVCVVAYKTVNGVDKVLGRTVTAHVVGAKNKKYSNPKKLTIVSKTKLSLKTGKSAKIISKVTLVNKKRKSLSDAHAPMFRYASTNKKVVTVNKKGKIKAVGKGQCYIWIYAKNGYGKKVKVTVS